MLNEFKSKRRLLYCTIFPLQDAEDEAALELFCAEVDQNEVGNVTLYR